MRRILKSLVACIIILLATACDRTEEPSKIASHTLLIYIAGDNSLSMYALENVRLIKQGLLNSTSDINIIVYKDSRDYGDNLPTLVQYRKKYDKTTQTVTIEEVTLETFKEDFNSCDPEMFTKIVNRVFRQFNTEVKGLEMWSHGMSWIPNKFSQFSNKATRYVSNDEKDFFDLWDFRTALEKCPHLDYVLFDACFMGMAEVANELDNCVDYIYAPITEIFAQGFPYNTMIPILAECESKNTVCHTLENCMDDFVQNQQYGNEGYTLTLLKTANAGRLSKAIYKLRKAVPEKITALENDAYNYIFSQQIEPKLQHYSRSGVRTQDPLTTRYMFYELNDYVDYLAKDGSAEVQAIYKEIQDNNIIVKYVNTDYIVPEGYTMSLKNCRGLGVSIPEFFNFTSTSSFEDSESEINLIKYVYGLTKWGRNQGF